MDLRPLDLLARDSLQEEIHRWHKVRAYFSHNCQHLQRNELRKQNSISEPIPRENGEPTGRGGERSVVSETYPGAILDNRLVHNAPT